MILLIQLAGWVLIFLAALHAVFPRYFKWNTDLSGISLINRQIMGVHTFFIALVLFLIGLLCVALTPDLVGTKLGRTICLGLSVFWGIRLAVQFFWYSPKLWKGKRFETLVHVGFVVLWSGLTLLFGWAGLGAKK